jgi:hypothetical protein
MMINVEFVGVLLAGIGIGFMIIGMGTLIWKNWFGRKTTTYEIFLDLVLNIVEEKKDPEKIANELKKRVYLHRAMIGQDMKGNLVQEVGV